MNPYPAITEYFLVGKTLKSHGTAGQLRVSVENRFRSYLAPGSFLFFDLDGSRVPFQITAAAEDGHFVISLRGIDTKEDSDKLTQKECWIPLEQVKSRHRQSPGHIREDWSSYSISDTSTGQQFPILRTEEFPQQLMAVIDVNGKEIYVPLHDQLIESIDRAEKRILMDLPEGLLAL